MFITDQGFLLRKADSSERYTLLIFFLKGHGLQAALTHKRSKPDPHLNIPDLFECGEVVLQKRGDTKPAFLKEFSTEKQFPQIALHYPCLVAACQLARFYEQNLLHMESYADAWDLFSNAIASLAMHKRPSASLFKALYVFARTEGYPVRAQWLDALPIKQKNMVMTVIQSPIQEIEIDSKEIEAQIINLSRFLKYETDIIPIER